jgi:hypothetical protein
MNAPPPDKVTRASGKEPRRTPDKNRKGHKAEHGNHTKWTYIHEHK